MTRHLPLILVLCGVFTTTSVHAEGPFEVPTMTLDKGDGHVVVTVTLTPKEGANYPSGKVPFTAEPYSILVMPSSTVVEYNLFDSGLAMDLDGDGKSSGTIPVGCYAGGVLQIGATPVRPFVETLAGETGWRGNYRNPDGSPRLARIGDKGAWYGVYTPCGPDQPTTIALARTKREIAVHEVPGPVLQFMVFEEVFVPSASASVHSRKLALDGRPVRRAFKASTHAYEPVFDAKPAWHAVVWRMIPLGDRLAPHTLTARLDTPSTDRRRLVVAIINQSSESGIRERVGSASSAIAP